MPANFPTIQRLFFFQSDTIGFLKFYGFDFNKFAYHSIPYISAQQESELRKRLSYEEISEVQSNFKGELEDLFKAQDSAVKKWYASAKEGDRLAISQICKEFNNNFEILYFAHKNFRRRFKNVLTSIRDKEFVLEKVSSQKLKDLTPCADIDEELVSNLLGFTKVFRLLTTLKKPIVGHNLLQDILLLIESFDGPLPHSYNKFKKLAHDLFPLIFDTKTISYELRPTIPEEKRWDDKGLESIFDFFKNGTGRHLALNSPAIEAGDASSYGKFHEAGWDSFCAGYVFIRMAYLNVYQNFPKSKRFVSSELIAGLGDLKNRVNVIRGSLSSIKIDGEDPVTRRPPFLVVEAIKNGPVNIQQIASLLGAFGFVEVRRLPYQNSRALVAVDNFGNARRILNNFRSSREFQIKQYSVLRHSAVVRAFLMGGITISGVILIWMTRSMVQH